MTRRTGLGAWLTVLLLACSPSPTGSPPTPTSSPSSSPSSSSAIVSPSAMPSDSRPPSAVPTAAASQATSSPPATATPAPVLTVEEAGLTSWLREDARVDCRPRRTDLPDGALLGAECFPGDGLVARVGIYEFATRRDAAKAYLARMSSAGVEPDTEGCIGGVPADTHWAGGDPDDIDIEPNPDFIIDEDGLFLSAYRFGCFHDEDGAANFRTTCWAHGGIYIGVLGRTRDIGALTEWAMEYPDDISELQPGPPGICPYEPGLGELEEPLASGDTP